MKEKKRGGRGKKEKERGRRWRTDALMYSNTSSLIPRVSLVQERKEEKGRSYRGTCVTLRPIITNPNVLKERKRGGKEEGREG